MSTDLKNKIFKLIDDSVGDSVDDSVWNSVDDSVWNSVWRSVHDSVMVSARNTTDSIRDPLKETLNEYRFKK